MEKNRIFLRIFFGFFIFIHFQKYMMFVCFIHFEDMLIYFYTFDICLYMFHRFLMFFTYFSLNSGGLETQTWGFLVYETLVFRVLKLRTSMKTRLKNKWTILSALGEKKRAPRHAPYQFWVSFLEVIFYLKSIKIRCKFWYDFWYRFWSISDWFLEAFLIKNQSFLNHFSETVILWKWAFRPHENIKIKVRGFWK